MDTSIGKSLSDYFMNGRIIHTLRAFQHEWYFEARCQLRNDLRHKIKYISAPIS